MRVRARSRVLYLLVFCFASALVAPHAYAQLGTGKTIAIGTDLYSGMLRASDGNFYTSTNGLVGCVDNDNNNCAAIYRVAPDGTISVLHQFQESDGNRNANVNADGLAPTSLIEGADGYLYGTCAYGGPAGTGTIFKVSLSGAFTLLYSFGAPHGVNASPQALIQGSDGNLYGVAPNAADDGQSTGGLFFGITTGGEFTPLHYFSKGSDHSEGYYSNSLVQGDDGNFYVTLSNGAGSAPGAIDKVTPAGKVSVWYNFATNNSQGDVPEGPLVEGKDTYLYGVTQSSRSTPHDYGYAFKVNASGNFQVLHEFTGGSDGGLPQYPLYLASDGNFYGTAVYGGDLKSCLGYGCGLVFQLTSAGTLNPVWDFEGGEATSTILADNPKVFGAAPKAPVAQGTGGTFYGTTDGGGGLASPTVYDLSMKTPIPSPIQLTFNPSSVTTGNETTLTWKVLNAFSKTAQFCSGHVLPNPEFADSKGVWNNEVQAGKLVNGVYTGSTTIAPIAAGAYTFALTCGGQESGFATLLVTGKSPLKIETTSVPKASVSTPYRVIFGAEGGVYPYTWTEAGTLPKGLTFAGTGILSGKPLQFGTYSFAVGVKDSSDPPLTDAVGIDMTVVSSLTLSPVLPPQSPAVPYSAQLDTSGGVPPYSFKLVSGSFPPGLVWNPVNGVISGTATESGKYTFVIEASDYEQPPAKVQQTFVLPTLAELKVTTPGILPNATVNVPYSVSLSATGGVGPYSWAFGSSDNANYKPPPGLTLSKSGTLSGTPTQSEPDKNSHQYFNVKLTDSEDPPASVTTVMGLYVKSTLKITTDSLPNGQVGTTTEVPLTATGGIPPYKWAAASTPPPNEIGLYINDTDDGLVYIPLIATTANVTLYLEDSEPKPAYEQVALPLTILPAPIATKTVLASSNTSVTTGQSVTFTAAVTIASGGAPGGLVTFFNGTSIIGTAALNAKGVAILTTSFPTVGSFKIVAAYNGNTTDGASKSAAVTETVTSKK